MTAHPRFDLEPLMDATGADTLHALSVRIGIRSHSLTTWATTGIPWSHADRLAVAAGYHPAVIWPDWLDHSINLNRQLCDDPSLSRYTNDPRCRCPGCTEEARQYQAERRARRREATA